MKETKIEIPAGFEVGKTEVVDGALVVTFKPKEPQLPKEWEEFCETTPIQKGECYIDQISEIEVFEFAHVRRPVLDANTVPNRETAKAVLALCQLIQLRECYNKGWVPNWNKSETKIVIDFCRDGDLRTFYAQGEVSLLAFKDKETADEFLQNFRPLIEKLKPLYGIKEGGSENDQQS